MLLSPRIQRLNLIRAARDGDVRKIKRWQAIWPFIRLVSKRYAALLLDGAAELDGAGALLAACSRRQVECAKLLLLLGADVNAKSVQGLSALHLSASLGDSDLVAALLAAGADQRMVGVNGGTPLLVASGRGHSKCARLLLEQSTATLEVANPQGITAMFMCCHHGHAECVRLLSSYGADRSLFLVVTGHIRTAGHGGGVTRELWAEAIAHDSIRSWLRRSRWWTALHHVDELSPARARELLRRRSGPAALHCKRRRRTLRDPMFSVQDLGFESDGDHMDDPSPLEIAQDTLAVDPAHEVAKMVLRAAAPWSPSNAELFPEAARARARELLKPITLLAHDARLGGGMPHFAAWLIERIISIEVERVMIESEKADRSVF